MNRNQIIEQLFTGKNFNDCLSKMNPESLREDLKQEVILIVCEWPEERIIGLHQRKELEFFTVRVILNLIKSRTSPFFKKYRMLVEEYQTDQILDDSGIIHNYHLRDFKYTEKDALNERRLKEDMEDYTIEQINTLYWYDAEILRLYMKLGSFRKIQEQTKIPHISCFKSVKKSMEILKARSGENKPLFSKEEIQFIKR